MMWQKVKNAWKSVTIWFNGIVVASIPVLDYAKDNFEQLREYIDADFYKMVGLVVVGLNILLRFKTSKDLAEK